MGDIPIFKLIILAIIVIIIIRVTDFDINVFLANFFDMIDKVSEK